MTTFRPPAFDPADLPESNATSYPDPFKSLNSRRWNRRLGDYAGLKNFGVTLTRIEPHGQSSARHAHARQDEFVWVLEGETILETDAGRETLRKGMCAAFAAGDGNAHRFLTETTRDVVLLVVGDRTPLDTITYPDIDLHAASDAQGKYTYTKKDGSAP